MTDKPQWPPRCGGSCIRVTNESFGAVGWGECPVCRRGFYVEQTSAIVTLPVHEEEKKA